MRTHGFFRRAARVTVLLGAAMAAPTLLGCNGGSADMTSIYVVPAALADLKDEAFFDQPWPSDLRIENGSPRFEGYPNPRQLAILAEYVEVTKGLLDGFSPAASGFVRFSAPLDPRSLPTDPRAGLDKSSSVQLIDIDPLSPDHGKRKLISLKWRAEPGVYYPPNTLAFMPTIGFPLRPHTRYALVVTDAIKPKAGGVVGPSDDLRQVLGLDAPDARTRPAHDALATAVSEIASLGVTRDRIVHLAVFTTTDPTTELFTVADDVPKSTPPPTAAADQWAKISTSSISEEYVGSYGPSPNYQVGKLPFQSFGDGGQFNIVKGKPRVVNTFNLRFSLTVPARAKCPMPPKGYPIVLYAHGTGGDYRSYVDDGTAASLAKHCMASMGVDQIFHGTRPGAPADGSESKIELLFFNFENPPAARTNGRQSAINEVQRARLFTETKMTLPAAISYGNDEVLFDASKLMFFGHSQGGLNGPLFLAADRSPLGGVLSGSGAQISIALLEKTEPQPSVSGLVKTVFLGLKSGEEAELDEFHPAMSLAQSIVDVLDPLHYARISTTEPRAGAIPKSIYMTEGINPDGTGDSYAPPHGIEAHGLALGLPLQLPDERAIVELQWGGVQPLTIPPAGLSGNLGGGAASGVLAQWAVPPDSDGHFVVFDVYAAKTQAAVFLKNLGDSPVGLVPPP